MRGSGVNDLCDHPWAVNMQVTITCSARTSNPTNAPSTAPTTAPTSTTNHPTAAPSGTPSAAPSSSPSHPPSLTPTSAPTSAPSDTPTSSTAIPTNTPSATPTQPSVTPSQPPTRTPTAITSQPTPNPIIKTADCDTNRDCWSVNVTPVPLKFMSVPVTVLSGIEIAVDTYYDVTFTVNTVACNRPSIDFVFEPTDNDEDGESLYVSAPGLSTQTCGGSSTYCSTCCSWFTCLSQMSVNNDVPIAIGQSITVTIQRDSSVGMQYCDDLNDVKAKVTLNCDDSTTSPTSAPSSPPTAAPSSVTITPSTSPSPAPTSAPSDTPTSITTIPTNIPSHSPTQSPTNAPSQPPTNAPSQSPTHPSASPSHSPSQSPTNAPSSAPSTPTINPTASPTYADPVTSSCGTRCTEYHVNIAPQPGVATSRTITVQGVDVPSYTSYFRILLTPKG
eukprot:119746_1